MTPDTIVIPHTPECPDNRALPSRPRPTGDRLETEHPRLLGRGLTPACTHPGFLTPVADHADVSPDSKPSVSTSRRARIGLGGSSKALSALNRTRASDPTVVGSNPSRRATVTPGAQRHTADIVPHPADLTTPLPAISEWTYASLPPLRSVRRRTYNPLGNGHRSLLSVSANPVRRATIRVDPSELIVRWERPTSDLLLLHR